MRPAARALPARGILFALGCLLVVPTGGGAGTEPATTPDGERIERYLADLAARKDGYRYGFFALPEAAFLDRAAELEGEFHRRLDALLDSLERPDPRFARHQRARLRYWWADVRLAYGELVRRFTHAPPPDSRDPLDVYLRTLDFDDPELLEVEEYRTFLDSYLARKGVWERYASDELRSVDHQLTRAKYRVALRTFERAEMRDPILERLLEVQIDGYGVRGMEEILAWFERDSTDPAAVERIRSLYERERGRFDGVDIRVYKRDGAIPLELFIVTPPDLGPGERRPAVAMFHGGGWHMGRAAWALPRARYFASRGLVGVAVQYRLTDRHDVTPVEQLADTRSAFRWLRQHAGELQIDPGRVAGLGWSAGGHLATLAALVDAHDEPSEDAAVRAAPDALVLWFPAVFVSSSDRWFSGLLRGRARAEELSPAHLVRPGMPPAIVFQGSADRVVPLWSVERFEEKMRQAGNRCELHVYRGRPHLFHRDPEDFVDTMAKADAFLVSLGWLEGEPDRETILEFR